MRKSVALALLGLCILPLGAMAQDGAPSADNSKPDISKYADKRVTLNFDNARLTEAIQTLMKSVGADFLIAPELKPSVVTVHLNNVRFAAALDVLLKSGSIPAEFTIDNGLFRFVPRKEPMTPPQEEATPELPEKDPFLPFIAKIPVKNMEAARMYALLTGTPFWGGVPEGAISGDVGGHREGTNFGFNNGAISYGGYGNDLFNGLNAANRINNASNLYSQFRGSLGGLLNGLINNSFGRGGR